MLENMPGCGAMRPGDVVRAMNGKSIMVQSTDCAGRLALADALCYSQSFWPRFIVDVGTMCDKSLQALGGGGCGMWTNSEPLYEYMVAAAMHTGDRVWRMPLWKHYKTLIADHHNVDVKTHGKNKIVRGQACSNAAFLNEFVPCGDWMHLDNRGTIYTDGSDFHYLRDGMTGRPTRTLIEFLSQLVCHRE